MEAYVDHVIAQILCHHDIQILNFVFCKFAAVIVHEPAVICKRNTVYTAIIGNRVYHGFRIGRLNLFQVFAAQLCDGTSLYQDRQLVICKHVNICCCINVLGYFVFCNVFTAYAIFICNVPFRMCFIKCITHCSQHTLIISICRVLVFLRCPNLQGNILCFNRSFCCIICSICCCTLCGSCCLAVCCSCFGSAACKSCCRHCYAKRQCCHFFEFHSFFLLYTTPFRCFVFI